MRIGCFFVSFVCISTPVIADQKWFIYAGGLLLSYAAGFVLTYFFGVPKEAEQPAETLEELEMQ